MDNENLQQYACKQGACQSFRRALNPSLFRAYGNLCPVESEGCVYISIINLSQPAATFPPHSSEISSTSLDQR